MKQFLIFCFMLFVATQINISAQSYSQSELPDILRADYDSRIEFKDNLNITCSRAGKGIKILADDASNIIRRPYDVLSYDLNMDWTGPLTATDVDSNNRFYFGRNLITVRIDSADLTEIEFDAVYIEIQKVEVNDILLDETPAVIDQIVTIPLPENTLSGDIVKIKISYKHIGTENTGFFLYKEGSVNEYFETGDSSIVEARLAYTMSEPMNARKWMPCNDASYDKAKASISVMVPKEFNVASNGLLQDIIHFDDDNDIYVWSDTTQIATYLMSANASKFAEHTEYYHRVSNPEDSIPVSYYMWENDYQDTTEDESSYDAEFAYRNTVRMMEFFSEKYVEYPFNKYGHVTVQPFDYGGMEHQTLTTLIRSVIRKRHPDQSWSRDWNNQMIIAHELAHQWLGDYITAATWNDLWINEGGAVYSEVLWVGNDYGETGYNNHLAGKWRGYMYNWKGENVGLQRHAIYDAPYNNLFDYGITYCKAGWVYHMLSSMLGEEQFLTTLRGLMEAYKYQSLETYQFRDYFKSQNPDPFIDFDTFFDQWIFNAGHPVYELSGNSQWHEGSRWVMTLNVNQVQEAAGKVLEVYQVPLTINFYH
nr:M1 family metallopeptidase [Candidatus Kapabacteria bacterium]